MLATVVKPSTTLTSFSRNAATSRLDNNNGRGLFADGCVYSGD